MSGADPLAAAVARAGAGLAGPGVVAVSGGADSVALLLALLETRPGEPLTVAHLNHQLRGSESDADEAFVRDLCARRRDDDAPALTYLCHRLDVAAAAREARDNLEGTARRLRYAWLAEVARSVGASWVATGHTADDQAETVLHRLLRGTGLKGLAGIAARRVLVPGVDVVRPLLGVTRAQVLAYLAAAGQAFREDRSNADPRFTRNRLRHELLPHLADHYNPAIASVLCRLATQAEEIQQAEEAAARDLLTVAERPRAGPRLVFERDPLMAAPRRRVRELLRLVWEREGWPVGAMGFAAWERAAAVALGEATAADLPGQVRARGRGLVFWLERRVISRPPHPPSA